jgi:hypothetical protein
MLIGTNVMGIDHPLYHGQYLMGDVVENTQLAVKQALGHVSAGALIN